MKRLGSLLLLLSAFASAADKPEFLPIPAEVWIMKDTTAKGAIILFERIHVENTAIHHACRVRIFNEAGKEAAELPSLPEDAFDLKARTVYPDGKSVSLDSKKDMQTKTILANSRGQLNRTVLIPPGLSTDCLVDIQWKEPRKFQEYSNKGWGGLESIDWTKPFMIQNLEIELSKNLSVQWRLHLGVNVRNPVVREWSNDQGAWKTLTFSDVPGSEPVPFSLSPARSMVRLDLSPVNPNLREAYGKAPDGFWQDLVLQEFKPSFEQHLIRGGAYREFSGKIRKDLKGSPTEMGKEIITRVELSLKNLSQLTFAEMSSLKNGKADWKVDAWDLNQTAKHMATNGLGIFLISYAILKDSGAPMKLALVADRDQLVLDPKYKNPAEISNFLIGVASPTGETTWFDPSMRFAAPGMVHEDYQATRALIVDCATWNGQFQRIEAQPAGFNLTTFAYHLDVTEDADTIRLEASFKGAPDYAERIRYMKLEPKEQSKLLKESLEQFTKAVVIQKAEVSDPTDIRKAFNWKAEGLRERVAGRHMEIHPFPLMLWPVVAPAKWPEARTIGITLPYQTVQTAGCSIKVPKGYGLNQATAQDRKNEFGSVSWNMELLANSGGEEAKVSLRIEISKNIAPASLYPQLKEFVRWVEEARQRTIVVEKK